jgi:ribose-phosphate pyrophosphokinase
MRVIASMPGNETFAARLAAETGVALGEVETRFFPDGETYVRLRFEPRGKRVDFVCTLARPDARFLPLVFAADAARELGATQVNLIAPYLGYMRQDRRFHEGEAVTSRAFARRLSQTFDSLVTVDPHLHRYPALSAVYDIPAIALSAAPLIGDWIRRETPNALVIGPDIEAEQWASAVAARAQAPHVSLRKERLGDREVRITLPDLTAYAGRPVVLVDDIASSARTLLVAAKAVMEAGFGKPVCAVVHPIFAENSYQRLRQAASAIVSSDSIEHPSNAIPLAPLVATALA